MFSTIMATLGTKVAAAAVAAAMLAGGAAGASAAVGGPDVADSVHDVLREAGVPVPGGDDEVTDADGEITDDVGDDEGDVQELDGDEDGNGEPRCREATQHALEVLNALLEDGRPVENAIDAIENCGNDDAGDDDGDDEDGDEPRCREATQHALERLNELLEDGRPVENAIEAIENCGPGDAGGDAEAATEDAGEGANPNASGRSGNANGNAENGKSHANPRAFGGGGD
ncbi:MAG TPA: hypothetical protein VFO59_08080 [Dehalococcoidia bacterium]|nr:hypothetical protein [Dehalococcoidia bacterium]